MSEAAAAAGASAGAGKSVAHGPLCGACGETTIVVRGEAVCPKCIPAGATMDEIAADRRAFAPGTSAAMQDAANRVMRGRIVSELALIRDRAEWLIRRLSFACPDKQAFSQDLVALRAGIAVGSDGTTLEAVQFLTEVGAKNAGVVVGIGHLETGTAAPKGGA